MEAWDTLGGINSRPIEQLRPRKNLHSLKKVWEILTNDLSPHRATGSGKFFPGVYQLPISKSWTDRGGQGGTCDVRRGNIYCLPSSEPRSSNHAHSQPAWIQMRGEIKALLSIKRGKRILILKFAWCNIYEMSESDFHWIWWKDTYFRTFYYEEYKAQRWTII